ncbi:aminoacyl-tRNA hydrolase [Mariniblastus sp.]|nr:aminoacyl-tRNA hydrolase [Mariniblastus sp.]
MKIVVGLGNPGQKYKLTRHNVGFDVLTDIAQRYLVGAPKSKFNAEVAEALIKNEKTILISPLTFMNLSGRSVQAAVDFYKVPLEDVLIVCDDINLDVGRLRLKPGGSAGGQNGLKDIIQRLGSDQFPRLRLGVGKVPARWDTADYVLGKFDSNDRPLVDVGIKLAADAIEVWIESGLQTAMNRFNADPNKKPKQKKPKPKPNKTESRPAETKTPEQGSGSLDNDTNDPPNDKES